MKGFKFLGKQRGFSLVELMMGIAILVLVLCGTLLTYLHCMLLNQTGRNLAIAATDAQYVLEHMKALAYDDLDDYASVPPSFTHLSGEQISFIPAPVIGTNLATVTVKVSWQERRGARSFSLSTFIAR